MTPDKLCVCLKGPATLKAMGHVNIAVDAITGDASDMSETNIMHSPHPVFFCCCFSGVYYCAYSFRDSLEIKSLLY